MSDEGKFVTRELKVREMIYLNKASRGDYEARAMLVESRLAEPIIGLYEMPVSDFNVLFDECMDSVNETLKMSIDMTALIKASR